VFTATQTIRGETPGTQKQQVAKQGPHKPHSLLTGLNIRRLTVAVSVRCRNFPQAGPLFGGRLQRASTWVQPSRTADLTGIGSNTAPSTILWPRCIRGGPAISGTSALTRRLSLRSPTSVKSCNSSDRRESRLEATILSGTGLLGVERWGGGGAGRDSARSARLAATTNRPTQPQWYQPASPGQTQLAKVILTCRSPAASPSA